MGAERSGDEPPRWQTLTLLAFRVLMTIMLIGGTYEFARFYLWSIGLLQMTEASARREWALLTGDCKGQTALDCASGLVDQSLATAMGFAGVAAAVIPALWFVKKRWELGSAFVAAVAGLVSLLSVRNVSDKGTQLLLVLCALAFSVVINFAGRAIDAMKARAAEITTHGRVGESEAEVGAWAAAKVVIPPVLLYLAPPTGVALYLIVALVQHL